MTSTLATAYKNLLHVGAILTPDHDRLRDLQAMANANGISTEAGHEYGLHSLRLSTPDQT